MNIMDIAIRVFLAFLLITIGVLWAVCYRDIRDLVEGKEGRWKGWGR